MNTKRCKTCGNVLTIPNFSLDSRSSDGHKGECKGCSAIRSRQWRSRRAGETLAGGDGRIYRPGSARATERPGEAAPGRSGGSGGPGTGEAG